MKFENCEKNKKNIRLTMGDESDEEDVNLEIEKRKFEEQSE